jgi:glycosyltransferase involved in cell wall biosynthesis
MKISVIIRTCCRPNLLKNALASIELQTHKDWEVIVFDDSASTENFDIFKKFRQRTDNNVYYLTSHSPYYFFTNSWLMAPDIASGEVMIRLDDDDILVEDCLEFVSHIYENNPELDFTYGSSAGFEDEKLKFIIQGSNPFEIPKTRNAWAPYLLPNNKPWKEPWMWYKDYYSDAQNYTSIIHAAKTNALCIYHSYTMRTQSVKRVKHNITVTSNFVDDLEFLGSLDYLGLGHNSIKKILTYVGVHEQGRVTDKGRVTNGQDIWNENLRIRDKVDELRPSGFISKIINLHIDKKFINSIDKNIKKTYTKFYSKVKEISDFYN